MEKQIKEEWRPVRGFEDWAEISNYGLIHRFERVYYSGRNHKIKKVQEESWIWGSENNKGYLTATIGCVSKGVHIWVYETFVGDIPEGYDVNHLDENHKNNRLDNLNLLSHGDNMRYGTGIERRAEAHRGMKHSEEAKQKMSAAKRGRKRPAEVGAKISAANKNNPKRSKAVQALNPKTLAVVYEFPSTREAKRQGFDQGAVSNCCNGKFKTYKGFIWRFKE